MLLHCSGKNCIQADAKLLATRLIGLVSIANCQCDADSIETHTLRQYSLYCDKCYAGENYSI